jgi:hypothetical protein
LSVCEDEQEAISLAEHLHKRPPRSLGQPRRSRRGLHGLCPKPARPRASDIANKVNHGEFAPEPGH